MKELAQIANKKTRRRTASVVACDNKMPTPISYSSVPSNDKPPQL